MVRTNKVLTTWERGSRRPPDLPARGGHAHRAPVGGSGDGTRRRPGDQPGRARSQALRPAEDVDGDDRVRIDEAVAQHRPLALADVGELRGSSSGRARARPRRRVTRRRGSSRRRAGGRRRGAGRGDDSPVALLGADDGRADRGLGESVHGVLPFVRFGGCRRTPLRRSQRRVTAVGSASPGCGIRRYAGRMAESWRVCMICTIRPIADVLAGALRELGHEPVALVAPRRAGGATSRRSSLRLTAGRARRPASISSSPGTSGRSSGCCAPTSPT